jgi:hypothetical protein
VDAQEDFYDIPVVTAMPLATPTARPQRSAAVAERSQSTPTRNDLARSQYLSSFENRANRANEARNQPASLARPISLLAVLVSPVSDLPVVKATPSSETNAVWT